MLVDLQKTEDYVQDSTTQYERTRERTNRARLITYPELLQDEARSEDRTLDVSPRLATDLARGG